MTGVVIRDSISSAFTGVTYTATQSGGAFGFNASRGGNINDTVTMTAGSKITDKATGAISAFVSLFSSDRGSLFRKTLIQMITLIARFRLWQ
jgi:hypothetical protein